MELEPSIKNEIKLRGYNPNQTIIIPTENLLHIKDTIDTLLPKEPAQIKRNISSIKRDTHSFYRKHFVLNKIPYYKKIKVWPLNIEFETTIHPFNLPIKKEPETDSFYGCLREIITLKADSNSISYRYLNLSSDITEISKLSYTHEIAHTQLNHIRGIIEEYYNTELISILLETIHAFEDNKNEHLLNIHDHIRLSELKIIIEELKKYHTSEDINTQNTLIEGSLYATSTLKAYNIFFKYYYGNQKTKKFILSNIQRIFNQEITVEEFLTIMEVDFNNSQDPLLIEKYLTR